MRAIGRHVKIPTEKVPEAIAARIESDVPELPDLALALRKAAITAGKSEAELEGYVVSRAKQSLNLTVKFVNRVSGGGDYADALGVGRVEVCVYKNGKWVTVKKDEVMEFLRQFLDEKQLLTWRSAYYLKLSFLAIYYYLSAILESLDIVELEEG